MMQGPARFLRSLFAAVFISLMVSCGNPGGTSPDNPTEITVNQKAVIVFDNTGGLCTVSVYDDNRRREEDKIAVISAGRVSQGIEWHSGASIPFYFEYHINLKGISGFTISYVPEKGKDQKAVRIDAGRTNNITVPRFDETVASSDTLLSDKSYLFIQNNSGIHSSCTGEIPQ